MIENDDKDINIDKKTGITWTIIITILVVGGQIAFLIALSKL